MKAMSVLLLVLAGGLLLREATSETTSPKRPTSSNSAPRNSWEGLAIVVNRQNPIDNVTLGQLRQVFFGERRWWSSKRRVTLVARPRGAAERQPVLRVIYRMNDQDLDKYFFFGVYRGEFSTSPATVATPGDVRKFVEKTPGAIGYLRASDADDSVKVIRVNGLLPEDDGYPLRLRSRLTR
jgi:ABC-type phosphate transport system substrate-binding protein